MLKGGPTFRRSRQVSASSSGASPADIAAQVQQYFADNPVVAQILTVDAVAEGPAAPVDRQLLFVDNDLDTADNGVWGFKEDRNWKQIAEEVKA